MDFSGEQGNKGGVGDKGFHGMKGGIGNKGKFAEEFYFRTTWGESLLCVFSLQKHETEAKGRYPSDNIVQPRTWKPNTAFCSQGRKAQSAQKVKWEWKERKEWEVSSLKLSLWVNLSNREQNTNLLATKRN